MENSDLQKHRNFDLSDVGLPFSQFLGSSSSLSLHPEVPDIRNWFSSYAYESPDSDSCDNVIVSISEKGVFRVTDLLGYEKKETEKKRKSCEFKKNENRNEEISPKKYLSTDFPPKFQSPNEDEDWSSRSLHSVPVDVRNWFPSYVYESLSIDSSDEFGDGDAEYNQRGIDELIAEESKEGKETISGESRDTRATYEEIGNIKEDNQLSDKLQSHGGGGRSVNHLSHKFSSQSTAKARLEEKTVETRSNNEFQGIQIEKQKEQVPKNSPTSSANSESKCLSGAEKERKQIHHPKGSSQREALSKDGFIPIRKSELARSNGKSLAERPPKNGVHRAVSRGSALADITNFRNSITGEVLGKWRCPQEGKPKVGGPPLKQLRLEQWVQKRETLKTSSL